MPFSITRWKISDKDTMHLPTKAAVQPYTEAGLTNGFPSIKNGPYHDLPADEYECERFWLTETMAQTWLEEVDQIAKSLDVVCVKKSVKP